MNMKNLFKPKYTALAAAMGLAFAGTAANAAPTATIYGNVSLVGTYTSATTTSSGSSPNASYGVSNDASRLGIKGDLGSTGGTTFFYKYEMDIFPNQSPTLNAQSPTTYLGYIGAKGGWGSVEFGRPYNPFYTYIGATFNPFWWFFTDNVGTRGMNSSIVYTTPSMSGFQGTVGLEHIGKGSSTGAKSTQDFSLAGSYGTGPFSVAAAFTSYSKYADGATKYSLSNIDNNVWGVPSNTYAGQVLKSKEAVSGTYNQGPFSVALGLFFYNPADINGTTAAKQNSKTMTSVNIFGSYAFAPKWTVMADFSTTSQGSDGTLTKHKGNFTTLSVAYAPVDAVSLFAEYQNFSKDAVVTGLDEAGGSPSQYGKSYGQFAIGGWYSF